MKSETANTETTKIDVPHTIPAYIRTVEIMNLATAQTYSVILKDFAKYVSKEYASNVDDLMSRLKGIENNDECYEVLNNYAAYLHRNINISAITIKQRITVAKNFLEYYDIEVSPRKFRLKIKLPKIVKKNKAALSKEDIINILNSCSDIRLKTYVMLLAGTGMRATEALSTRLCDYDLSSEPAKVRLRGEYTKTKTDRIIFLTNEMVNQLKSWIEYKYRPRRICYYDKTKGKAIGEFRVPKKNSEDLVFSSNRVLMKSTDKTPLLRSLYHVTAYSFARTLDRMGKGEREEGGVGKRRKLTLHTFRRWVKSTISDLGFGDFSEYFIGHSSVSTYYRKTDKEKEELFKKIEPSLTFLDFPSLERKGSDFQSKIDVLEKENLALRQRDSVNADAIQNLSDQLMKVVAEVQELKRS